MFSTGRGFSILWLVFFLAQQGVPSLAVPLAGLAFIMLYPMLVPL